MSWTDSAARRLPAAGFHHVVYGLGIGIRHPALAEDEPEAQLSVPCWSWKAEATTRWLIC